LRSPLVIRADAAGTMGTGHIMRCLALAQEWQDRVGNVIFAYASAPEPLVGRLRNQGMQTVCLSVTPVSREQARETAALAQNVGAPWIVVDGYGFNAEYQCELKCGATKILVVDDDGRCDSPYADLILNQNAFAPEALYRTRSCSARLLLGNPYILLRREFTVRWSDWKRAIPKVARRVLLSMGGTDPDHLALRFMQVFAPASLRGVQVDVVVGPGSSDRFAIEQIAKQSDGRFRVYSDPPDLPQLMSKNDVAVIAAGGTLWELLFMGCAVLSFARYDVQQEILQGLERREIVQYLTRAAELERANIATRLGNLLRSPALRATMSENARHLVDGRGAERVVQMMCGFQEHVRP